MLPLSCPYHSRKWLLNTTNRACFLCHGNIVIRELSKCFVHFVLCILLICPPLVNYVAICPDLPVGENVLSTCDGAWSGIRCALMCAPGTVASNSNRSTGDNTRDLFCDGSAIWRSQSTQMELNITSSTEPLLECIKPICITTIGLVIEGFQCDEWDENTTEYVMDVPFEVGRNISILTLGSDQSQRDVSLMPGDNEIGVFRSASSVDYTFVVRMAGTKHYIAY